MVKRELTWILVTSRLNKAAGHLTVALIVKKCVCVCGGGGGVGGRGGGGGGGGEGGGRGGGPAIPMAMHG